MEIEKKVSSTDTICKHEDFVALDYTCIQCNKCKAVSYHRDSGGVGQPKEAVWSKGVLSNLIL